MNKPRVSGSMLQLTPFNYSLDCANRSKYFYYDEYSLYFFESSYSEGYTVINASELVGSCNFYFRFLGSSEIYTIRMNKLKNIVIIQRSASYIEFIKLSINDECAVKCLPCRNKNEHIRSFYFLETDTVLLVSDNNIDIYKFIIINQQINFIRTHVVYSNWEVFYSLRPMLILAPDTQTPNLKCLFLENNLNFITSIDIKPEIIDYKGLTKKDINLVTLYNNVYLVIFGLSQNYVYIYTVDVMSKNNFYLMFFLKCENFKNMSLNTIDNMIALHNFTKKITYLYDINIFTHSDATGIKTCQQLFKISTLPVENIVHKNREEMDIFSSMYIFFNPDILIDSLNGAVYQFHLNMDAVQDAFQLSYSALLNFLSHRIDGKYAILSYLSTSLPLNKNTIGTIREMFLCILYYNDRYKNKQVTLESQFPNPINAVANYIDQHDILVNIFFPLINSTQYLSSEELYYHLCFCETVVFTYISCMLSYNIQAKHFICECLVDVMIKLGKIDQLNEIIGSKLLPDNRDFTLYLTKICKNYPILIKNVMNICCRVNCLGAFIELAAQACTPETIKEIIKSINSLPLITDTGKQIHLLEELKLKINDNSYMDFTINNVELESICYLLRNTAIKNLYD